MCSTPTEPPAHGKEPALQGHLARWVLEEFWTNVTQYSKIKWKDQGCTSEVQHVPGSIQVPGSIPSTGKKTPKHQNV
jgi:hypothetical protein